MPKRNRPEDENKGESIEKQPKKAKRPQKHPPSPAEWPPLFTLLESVHRNLNSLFTFSHGMRRNVTTTLEIARRSAMHKDAMTPEHVAMVASLLPGALVLEYKDERLLQARPDDPFDMAYARDSSWTSTALDDRDAPVLLPTEPPSHVLCYEFTTTTGEKARKADSPLQQRSRRKANAAATRKALSPSQITQLVVRRNQAFRAAVDAFIAACAAAARDPEDAVRAQSRAFLPVPPSPPSPPAALAIHGVLPAAIPAVRAPVYELLQQVYASALYTDQVGPMGSFVEGPRGAAYADLDFVLSQRLVDALYNARGIVRFYTHQAAALNALHGGRSAMVATATGSGKSLIFQMPVLRALEADGDVRALFIFPTKALAQDQKQGLRATLAYMAGLEDVLVDTYDGDTPLAQRDGIRENARILFTNPDMLHVSILPQHRAWKHVLVKLRFVVVDELHAYDDRFGAHVAYIMRRLRRLCALYGNTSLQFIACSATLANPGAHFQRIFGVDASDVAVVSHDGSPSMLRQHILWNTSSASLLSAAATDPDHAANQVSQLFCALLLRGLRILLFCETTAQVEAALARIRAHLGALGHPGEAQLVGSYRGGYTAAERRRIERDLFGGRLRGVVATSALELGVDVGVLDCVVTWGFPRSVASLRQQWGRAGRATTSTTSSSSSNSSSSSAPPNDALLVFVAGRSVADQYVVAHADELRTVQPADAWTDLSDAAVRGGHLNCAAAETPIDVSVDATYFGADLADFLRPTNGAPAPLVEDCDMPGRFYARGVFGAAPASRVAIRDVDGDVVTVVDLTGGRFAVLEEMKYAKARTAVYKNGEYLHQGERYVVREFNVRERIAKVERLQ